MRFGSDPPSLANVKSALERQYHCMRVDCEAVGGLWTDDSYADGTSPCNNNLISKANTGQERSVGGPIIGTTLAVITVALLTFMFLKKQSRRRHHFPSRSNITTASDIA